MTETFQTCRWPDTMLGHMVVPGPTDQGRTVKNIIQMLVVGVVLCYSPVLAAPKAPPVTPPEEVPSYANAYVVVLGTSRNFYSLRRQAQRIAIRGHASYADLGRVYDKKRGLIIPDGDDDSLWAGQYCGRRGGDGPGPGPFVSVERADFYEMQKGRYVIVGAVEYSLADARKERQRYLKTMPDAYIKKVRMYVGCRH